MCLSAHSGSETAQCLACWTGGIGAREYLRLVFVVGDVQTSQVTASAEVTLKIRNGPVSASVTTRIGAQEYLRLVLVVGDIQFAPITASAGVVRWWSGLNTNWKVLDGQCTADHTASQTCWLVLIGAGFRKRTAKLIWFQTKPISWGPEFQPTSEHLLGEETQSMTGEDRRRAHVHKTQTRHPPTPYQGGNLQWTCT